MHFRIFPGALSPLLLRPLLCFLNGAIGVRLTQTYDITWDGRRAANRGQMPELKRATDQIPNRYPNCRNCEVPFTRKAVLHSPARSLCGKIGADPFPRSSNSEKRWLLFGPKWPLTTLKQPSLPAPILHFTSSSIAIVWETSFTLTCGTTDLHR